MTKRCLGCRCRTNASYCSQCWHIRRKIRTGWAWGEIREHIRRRDRVCVQCGSADGLQVHHRIPLRDGGSNTLSNLELRCRRCHRVAHAIR
jgi:5-methylcytosine-specific restriction endonuclease McrA